MASSPKVTPQKDKVPEKGGSETPPDSPLLDLSDAAVKKLIRSAKKRGYVTHDQIKSLSEEVNSEQIEDILAMFSEMGVNVVETEETSDDDEQQREEPDEEPEAEGGELVEVKEGKVFLRDIIDLEGTYAGPDAKAIPAPVGLGGQPIVVAGIPIPGQMTPGQPPQTTAPATAPASATPFKTADKRADGEEP